jgi:diguanylate cyclase (GGDEF)-like protein
MKIENSFFETLSHIAILKSDSEEMILKKVALTLLPVYVFFPALIWGVIYLYLGHPEASLVPFFYIFISLLSLSILYKTKKFIFFERTQLLLILILPFVLMWTLGGFAGGSFVMIWSFYAPVAAIMYSEDVKSGFRWFAFFLLLVLLSVIIDTKLSQDIQNTIPKIASDIFFALNVGVGFSGIYLLISHFVKKKIELSEVLKKDKEILSTLTDDLKNANKELEMLASCDVVTKLPNRLCFQDIVYDMFKRARQSEKIVAIMFLDLDGFKTINDTLGHDAGDKVLKMVGERLSKSIRTTDTVARVGGDEFAIALGDITDIQHVKNIAETLIKEVNEYCPYKDQRCHVGVSIGISFFPEHGDSVEELMLNADKAMYDIKKMGKNSYSIFKE